MHPLKDALQTTEQAKPSHTLYRDTLLRQHGTTLGDSLGTTQHGQPRYTDHTRLCTAMHSYLHLGTHSVLDWDHTSTAHSTSVLRDGRWCHTWHGQTHGEMLGTNHDGQPRRTLPLT